MSLKKFSIQPGNVIRGMMIRLYPETDDIRRLALLEDDLRHAWNWLVREHDRAVEAGRVAAVRAGLVGSRPTTPDYDGLLV